MFPMLWQRRFTVNKWRDFIDVISAYLLTNVVGQRQVNFDSRLDEKHCFIDVVSPKSERWVINSLHNIFQNLTSHIIVNKVCVL